ncbi:hypothetical protein DL771_008484 [Monosporascus sp. 5C6A]|nr:hypothetical protein DL771_008484 [Monosporascus sp. 5C6A]
MIGPVSDRRQAVGQTPELQIPSPCRSTSIIVAKFPGSHPADKTGLEEQMASQSDEAAAFTPYFLATVALGAKNREIFVKTNFQNRGKDLGGIIWEENPSRHREVARKLSPAFSTRSIRTMEPLVHQYIDYFVAKMKELSTSPAGVELVKWTNWLAMDLSADLAWNEKMYQMRDMKDSVHLDVLLSFNSFATVLQVFKRFPLLRPFQYLFAPMGKVRLFAAIEKTIRKSVVWRIEQKGNTAHVDFFDYILPANSPSPTEYREVTHIGSLAFQLMFAGWGPMGDLYYGALVLLIQDPECYKILTEEVRGKFKQYEDITPGALATLPYLHACLEEALRMLPSNNTGLPRVSPGAVVDGRYVPKGVSIFYYFKGHEEDNPTGYRFMFKPAFLPSLETHAISTIHSTIDRSDGSRAIILFMTLHSPLIT